MNRLFIAVPVRLNHYDRIQTRFAPQLMGRWRDESTLHVTVAFLGDAFTEKTVLQKLEGFDWIFEPTQIDGFDYFTGSRVFVATARNPSLQALRERLEDRLGLEEEVLRPHVTLMRVKTIIDTDSFSASMPQIHTECIGIMEPCVALYRSRLTPQGAHYSIVKEWRL